jgi:deoxyribodipyrimidine photolyase-related protein
LMPMGPPRSGACEPFVAEAETHGEDAPQVRPAAEDLRSVRTTFCLAEKVGARLGSGQDLFRSLQGRASQARRVEIRRRARMTRLRLVLGDQLTREVASLRDYVDGDVVLMAEVADETTYVKHHKQKIVFVLSAMRHFAEELRAEGLTVDYIKLDDPGNTGSLAGELQRAVARHRPTELILTSPGEWRLMAEFEALDLGIPVDIRDDDRFFATTQRFAEWAAGRKALRMEFFYREMRRETDLLMEGDEPAGGQWNYDSDNRKRLPKAQVLPPRFGIAPDDITRDVIALVPRRFADHFGDLSTDSNGR